jgi:hypothetical protein
MPEILRRCSSERPSLPIGHGCSPIARRRAGRAMGVHAAPTGTWPQGREEAPAPRTGAARRRHNAEEPPLSGGSFWRRNRRRPTLPGPCGPSTIGAEGLNCSVRNGKRCFPLAIATGNERELPAALQNCTVRHTGYHRFKKIRQALDPLVPVSFARCRASRSGLSTWWSTRGLTPSRGWENSS